ncbi:hypothetical protein [Mycobacterium kyorinense]|uniref:hypothetical protein n=1 Tax=Mycobacterium kyorinense TaxID=487514 RepID=UPI000A9F464F|nr:hypothetical protein [Mycobacterium kyorinense]
MDWHEHIIYETPERDHLVQRRFYIDDSRWSWAVIGDERKMILTDNIGDVRVRSAHLGRTRILAEAEKGPNRPDPWTVSFPAESGRHPRVAGRVELAIAWMATALHWDPQADARSREFNAPEAVAHRVGLPWPDNRAEYRTEAAYQEAQEQHRAKVNEAGEALSKAFGMDEFVEGMRQRSAASPPDESQA